MISAAASVIVLLRNVSPPLMRKDLQDTRLHSPINLKAFSDPDFNPSGSARVLGFAIGRYYGQQFGSPQSDDLT